MKVPRNQVVHQVINVTVGALTLMLFCNSPLLANNVPYRVTNGLYRSSSQEFFEEGKRQFEKEIEILIQQLPIKPESLLNINDELQIKDEDLIDNPNFLLDNLVDNPNQR